MLVYFHYLVFAIYFPSNKQGWGFIPEKVKKAQKKMDAFPYDVDAWGILLREAQVCSLSLFVSVKLEWDTCFDFE